MISSLRIKTGGRHLIASRNGPYSNSYLFPVNCWKRKQGWCNRSLEIPKIRRDQMTTAYSSHSKQMTTADSLKYGIKAGLGGGLIFGILMAMMSMLPMVGMLVGKESSTVGFVLHMAISGLLWRRVRTNCCASLSRLDPDANRRRGLWNHCLACWRPDNDALNAGYE